MSSASWFFSKPLCKKQVLRFWPLWGIYSFLLLILLPVYQLLTAQRDFINSDLFTHYHQYTMALAAEGAPWIAGFYGIFLAMAMWSYLYNHRSVSMIHALPLNRKSLFLTNYLTGIAFFLIPNLVIFLLSICVEFLLGGLALQSLGTWLLVQTLQCFFFYSFATFLAFVTGHILVLPSLFIIFNFLSKALSMLLDWAFGEFVYGYANASVPFLNWCGTWLSPFYAFVTRLHTTYPQPRLVGQEQLAIFDGMPILFAYAAAGLLMVVFSYFLYNSRKLELSGEVIVVPFLQPVFRYGVAICAGLIFGNTFYLIFDDLSRGIWMLLFFLLLWGAIGYFAAEMLLRKSFWVVKKSFKGCLVLMLVFAMAMLAMEWDVMGYEKTVPSADQVEKVLEYGHRSGQITDPEQIKAVLALHQSLLQEKHQIERMQRGDDPQLQDLIYSEQNPNGMYIERYTWNSLQVKYQLTNGKTLTRRYDIPVTEERLQQEGSSAALYDTLLNQPEWRQNRLFPTVLKAEDLLQIQVGVVNLSEEAAELSYVDGGRMQDGNLVLSGKDAQLLYAAVLEDVQAGRLGKQWLLRNEECLRTNYANTIYFTFRGDYNMEDQYAGDWYTRDDKNGDSTVYYELNIPLQNTATATLAVLAQYGLSEGVNLVSEYEMQEGAVYDKMQMEKDYAYRARYY